MRVTVTFEVPASTDYTQDDVLEAVGARLDEVYPDGVNPVAPQNVGVTVERTLERTLPQYVRVGDVLTSPVAGVVTGWAFSPARGWTFTLDDGRVHVLHATPTTVLTREV